MFGLIALFDEKTEELIKDIWRELTERSISAYAGEVVDRKPHITFASYNNLNLSDFIEQMDVTYNNQSVIDIKFSTIGSFLSSGALFFAPTVTKDLRELHSNHHRDFERFNDHPHSLYLPDNWIPHCTIANRLSAEKLNEAFNYCSKRTSAIFGKIVEVALIDVSEIGKAPIIYSKELKK
ncbi:2'-5' RNA ligase family protein [Mesobacillus maritimus]|uniref:2'-5' RNA ligase family protein n=1 Tax=Mesobacillus maritimus TaxID=1643336 RepID=UPI00384A9CCA